MWLAQAPGPGSNMAGLGQNLRDIQQDVDVLEPLSGNADYFNASWSDYWQALPDSSPSNGTHEKQPEPKPGLSTGAKAGIGAGIGALALLSIAGLCVWWLKKKKKGESTSQTAPLRISEVDVKHHDASPPYSTVDPERNKSSSLVVRQSRPCVDIAPMIRV